MGLHLRKNGAWDGTEHRCPPSILVVNDEANACELLVRLLAQPGFNATGAGSDVIALFQLTEQVPRCVILDLQVGGVGPSLKLLEEIRRHSDQRISSARVVLCAPSPRVRSFSFQSAVDAFLMRPFHLSDLIAEVEDVLGRPQEERARHRRTELARLQ